MEILDDDNFLGAENALPCLCVRRIGEWPAVGGFAGEQGHRAPTGSHAPPQVRMLSLRESRLEMDGTLQAGSSVDWVEPHQSLSFTAAVLEAPSHPEDREGLEVVNILHPLQLPLRTGEAATPPGEFGLFHLGRVH